MTTLLRLLAPAALLGVFLLLGERPTNPPDELPAVELSAANDDLSGRPVPCPGLIEDPLPAPIATVRLPPAAAALLKADAPPPEPRSLSPPLAA